MKILKCPYCKINPQVHHFKNGLMKIECKNPHCFPRPQTKILKEKISIKIWNKRSSIIKYFINWLRFNLKPCKFCCNPMTNIEIKFNIKPKYKLHCIECGNKGIRHNIRLFKNPGVMNRMWNHK